MDKLTAAKVFLEVARTGSFSASADNLEMSRAMVTRYIECIENWLKTRLLHRTTRKVSLTSAGESSITKIESWVLQAQSIERLNIDSEELSGHLRIACSTSFAQAQLTKAINEFLNSHPKVKIDLDVQDNVSDLTKSRIDLAIRIAATPDPSLIGKPIAQCDSVLVASKQYLAAHPPLIHPKDLNKHQCLGYKNFERHVWHLSNKQQNVAVDINCRLTANEASVLLQAALEGAGISLQPSYLANSYIDSQQLIQVLPQWQPNSMKIYALYSSRKHLSRTQRSLIDFLSLYFQGSPW